MLSHLGLYQLHLDWSGYVNLETWDFPFDVVDLYSVIADILLVYCCCVPLILLSYCCYVDVILLLYCFYIVVILLLYCMVIVVILC